MSFNRSLSKEKLISNFTQQSTTSVFKTLVTPTQTETFAQFNQLPKEIQLHVFDTVDTQTLKNASLASKTLQDLLFSKLKKIKLKPNEIYFTVGQLIQTYEWTMDDINPHYKDNIPMEEIIAAKPNGTMKLFCTKEDVEAYAKIQTALSYGVKNGFAPAIFQIVITAPKIAVANEKTLKHFIFSPSESIENIYQVNYLLTDTTHIEFISGKMYGQKVEFEFNNTQKNNYKMR